MYTLCCLCAALESLEDDLAGVVRVAASVRTQQMEVEFDETMVNEAQIIAVVQQRGYQTIPV